MLKKKKRLFTLKAIAIGCKFKDVRSMYAITNKIFWKRTVEVQKELFSSKAASTFYNTVIQSDRL